MTTKNTIHTELKKAIINWLFENANQFNRLNACKEQFRQYIFTPEGNYCIGGKEVHGFIRDADKLIYNN